MLQLTLSAFSQNKNRAELYYELHGIYGRSMSQGELKAASTLLDINEKYPASWVKEYISVEISATCNGVEKIAIGENENLNAEQIGILKMADYDTEVVVVVKYLPDNMLTHNTVKTMDFALLILPEVEAEFPGGCEQMMKYLKENVANEIPESTAIEDIKWTAVRFIINAEGKIINLRAIGTSEFEDIDKILMDAISEMPQWKPAKDSNNVKVEQEFEFVLGNTSTMCNLNFYFMNEYFVEELSN